jgi:membrane protein required for colicin V production
MHWLDTTILALLVLGALFGARSGFLRQVGRVVGFVVALYGAVYFHEWAANVLQEVFLQDADPRVARVLAYLVVFVVIAAAFFSALFLLERGVARSRLQPINRSLGAGLGAAKIALILGAIFLGMAYYPHPRTQELLQKSVLAPALAHGVDALLIAVPQEYKQELSSGLANLRETFQIRTDELTR